MPTKTDLADMLADLHNSVRRDVDGVREEVVALADRVSSLEQAAAQPAGTEREAIPAYSGLRRLVDDLDNRGRRCNLRIRGLYEMDPPEQLEDVLRRFFNKLLGREAHATLNFQRAHRALRPRPLEGEPPRDVVCCLTSYKLKDQIMHSARSSRSWDFEGQNLELFHDLTPFTLAARRYLRPVTQALRQRNIPYRWGFPFALTVRIDGASHAITCPGDVAPFLAALNMQPIDVPDWERGEPWRTGGLPRPQRPPRHRRAREERDREEPDRRGADD
uniref:Uncharacterized protein n=1 Tax=Leptobrachium leishanense TaxID=445787 RepID=A0A8C5LQL7_9ANUR